MAVAEGNPAGWDFFVSYTQADRAWAEWIAWELEEAGYRVFVQAWDFVPGTNWIVRMQDGVAKAERTIAVLSSAYLESRYGAAEWETAWAADPEGQDRRLLAVRVEDCAQPGLLAGVVSVDLFGMSEEGTRGRLREMVSAALEGRVTPARRPAFPGRAIPRFPGRLPGVWKVPARNPYFTGRGEALAALGAALAAGPMVTVQSVRGMGGVGKSQLAAEFAHAHAARYEVVYWIAAEEPATVAGQFAVLAARLGLGLDPGLDPETLRARVHDRLREVANWLLVFDDADPADDIRDWIPGDPLPPGAAGHVIVTTRRAGFRALGPVMELDVLDLGSCADLLRARVPGMARAAAEGIANELGRLPLALEQAAAYLERTSMPPGQYLRLLRQRGEELFDRGQEETIATLWDITLKRVGRQAPAAVALLGLCAWLAPEPVPLDLFTGHTELLEEERLAAAAADPLAFSETVGVLADYSLAKRTESGLQLHRLVQRAVRIRHSSAAGMLGSVMKLLRADAPEEITGPQDWPRWAILLPHVLAAAGHCGRFSGQLPDTARDDHSWLLDRAATYLRVHARLAEARPLAERALSVTEEVHGPGHPHVAARLNNLASILQDQGRLAEAMPLAERALAIAEEAHGLDAPHVAVALNNLARILRDLGRSAEALPLAERALAIAEDEEVCGRSHPEVAIGLNNLAAILRDLGRLAEARPLAERALAIAEAVYGRSHPEVAIGLNNLAAILRDLGRLAEARPLAERALAIEEAVYGHDHPHHPRVGARLNNLAHLLKELRRSAEALPLAERALAIAEEVYEPDDPRVVAARSNLASIKRDLGEYEQAGAAG